MKIFGIKFEELRLSFAKLANIIAQASLNFDWRSHLIHNILHHIIFAHAYSSVMDGTSNRIRMAQNKAYLSLFIHVLQIFKFLQSERRFRASLIQK